MSTPPPNSPAQNFAGMMRWLTQIVVTRDLMGLLAKPIVWHLIDRIRGMNQRFARLAARIHAGTFVPRRAVTRRRPTDPKPRRPSPVPRKFGWMLPLVPDAVGSLGHLEWLFRDPDTMALIEAAPAEMARILRPLCWMLRATPPKILASPRRKPAPPEAPPAPEAAPPAPAPAPRAARPRIPPPPSPPAHTPRPASRVHGPPRPA